MKIVSVEPTPSPNVMKLNVDETLSAERKAKADWEAILSRVAEVLGAADGAVPGAADGVRKDL